MYVSKTELLFNKNTRGHKKMTETILMHPVILQHEAKEKQTKKKIDTTILTAIDESLSTFGASVKKAVYNQLEKKYRLKKQDIPNNIDEFVATIEGIFGVGAGLVEMKILETLYARTTGFAYIPDGEDIVFKDYVQSVRSFLGTSVTF
jgi:hypothetical protein